MASFLGVAPFCRVIIVSPSEKVLTEYQNGMVYVVHIVQLIPSAEWNKKKKKKATTTKMACEITAPSCR